MSEEQAGALVVSDQNGTQGRGKLKVYVAGSFGRRDELRGRAAALNAVGVSVTSLWLDKHIREGYVSQCERLYGQYPWMDALDAESAEQDLADVARADVFVLQTEAPYRYTTGGRLVELGAAITHLRDPRHQMRAVILVGRRENVFMYMPPTEGVHVVDTWEQATMLIQGIINQQERNWRRHDGK